MDERSERQDETRRRTQEGRSGVQEVLYLKGVDVYALKRVLKRGTRTKDGIK